MSSKEKSKHKFGDWLLKQEDETTIISHKRLIEQLYSKKRTIENIKKNYPFYKIGKIFLFWLSWPLILIGGYIKNNTLLLIGIIGIFIAIIITVIKTRTEDLNDAENYFRSKFDKIHGEGEYDKYKKEDSQTKYDF